jgi:8-oxo-dGTP pyrophosphatase MutT (NUDIX family)
MEQGNRRNILSGSVDDRHHGIKQGVGALIYSKKTKRYLFLLRDGSKYSGSWGLVGGKVELGELITDALYREINEEIGADFSDNKIVPIETFTSDNHKFVYYTFLISVDDEFIPTLNSEHKGYSWVYLTDYPRPLHPGVWRTFKFNVIIDKISTLERLL